MLMLWLCGYGRLVHSKGNEFSFVFGINNGQGIGIVMVICSSICWLLYLMEIEELGRNFYTYDYEEMDK